jgi:hypothetical protein
MTSNIKSKDELLQIAHMLSAGELDQITITKPEVLSFCDVIRSRDDFHLFYGDAQKGGNVIYTYNQNTMT